MQSCKHAISLWLCKADYTTPHHAIASHRIAPASPPHKTPDPLLTRVILIKLPLSRHPLWNIIWHWMKGEWVGGWWWWRPRSGGINTETEYPPSTRTRRECQWGAMPMLSLILNVGPAVSQKPLCPPLLFPHWALLLTVTAHTLLSHNHRQSMTLVINIKC